MPTYCIEATVYIKAESVDKAERALQNLEYKIVSFSDGNSLTVETIDINETTEDKE